MTATPQQPESPQDPLQALRAATSAQHEWLDSQLPLAKPEPAKSDYVMHLQGLDAWLQMLAPVLARTGWGAEHLGAVQRDLQECGCEAATAKPAGGIADDQAFAWGVSYVVEGSQLGGQVLFRRLRTRLAPLSLSYLQGRGPDTGAHWGRFLAALRVALAQPLDAARACEGAQWAFATLIDIYNEEERAIGT